MSRTHIHTPGERLAERRRGEMRTERSLVQLLCAVSALRTALTRVLPLGGGATWWVLLLCLLPGVTVLLLGRMACRMTGTRTLTEMTRSVLGQRGAWVTAVVLAALLLLDAAASMTALITLFTEGVGTKGTQLTLALFTGGALLGCLHRKGLPRGVYLLRWPLLAGAAVVLAAQLTHLRVDHLFPMQGGGMRDVAAALRAGSSLAWPAVLLLCLPGENRQPLALEALPALLPPAAVVLALCLAVPHEQLVMHGTLAECLLLPGRYAHEAVRLLSHCLLLLSFFLAIGGAALWSTELLCAPLDRSPQWLPYVVLALLTATQALDAPSLWRLLGKLEPWLLLPVAALTGGCLAISMIRRNRT